MTDLKDSSQIPPLMAEDTVSAVTQVQARAETGMIVMMNTYLNTSPTPIANGVVSCQNFLMDPTNTLNIAYINIRGQTGFNLAKQVEIEDFIKQFKIDVLHLQ